MGRTSDIDRLGEWAAMVRVSYSLGHKNRKAEYFLKRVKLVNVNDQGEKLQYAHIKVGMS